jgi:hypothetical protein
VKCFVSHSLVLRWRYKQVVPREKCAYWQGRSLATRRTTASRSATASPRWRRCLGRPS